MPKNDILLAFNSYSLSLVEFSHRDRPAIERILTNPQEDCKRRQKLKEIKKTLVKGGFLIDESRDEIQVLKAKNRIERFSSSRQLSLTIAPTLSCNFRCQYCYERHPRIRMTPAVTGALEHWVEGEIKEKDRLYVTWFGGEPLLALKELTFLSRRFLAMSRKKPLTYNATIITNGYLLKRKVAKELRDLGVTRAQITVDGPKEIHDRRRPLANGRGTFDVIMGNIKDACDLLRIDVRINVDKENAKEAFRLLDILEKEGLKNKVAPYLGHVLAYTDVCADVQSACFGREQFGLLEARLRLEMMDKGYRSSPYPHVRGSFCTADNLHSKTIGPSGAIVKCWNDICYDEQRIGHVLSPTITPRMESNFVKWMAWDPFDKKKCRECPILPICMGGCPHIAFKKELKNTGDCVDWKYNLKEMLSLYYLHKKIAEENEVFAALADRMEKIRNRISEA